MPRGGKTSTSGQGRKKGVPNKATQAAREAIGMFVDGNAHRLQGWLDQIAMGVKAVDENGKETNKYLVEPNPEKAFQLFQGVIEYHVPKLARVENEHSGTISLADAVSGLPPPPKR